MLLRDLLSTGGVTSSRVMAIASLLVSFGGVIEPLCAPHCDTVQQVLQKRGRLPIIVPSNRSGYLEVEKRLEPSKGVEFVNCISVNG